MTGLRRFAVTLHSSGTRGRIDAALRYVGVGVGVGVAVAVELLLPELESVAGPPSATLPWP